MTTPEPHPQAELLRWIADGLLIEERSGPNDPWTPVLHSDLLFLIYDRRTQSLEHYRVKPPVVYINGHEVPMPLRIAPPLRTVYWTPHLASASRCVATRWENMSADFRLMVHGLCHLTQEAAQAHTDALLSFTTAAEAPK